MCAHMCPLSEKSGRIFTPIILTPSRVKGAPVSPLSASSALSRVQTLSRNSRLIPWLAAQGPMQITCDMTPFLCLPKVHHAGDVHAQGGIRLWSAPVRPDPYPPMPFCPRKIIQNQ